MSLVPKNNVHFKLKNFGADKIYVISEKDSYRRKEFIKAWEWSDLEYEFVDAIMGKDLDIKSMIQDGKLDTFIDPSGNLSKNIIGVALSHQKAYKKALSEYDSNGQPLQSFLFLEDDARPTSALIDLIESGEYTKLLTNINNFSWDIFWFGRAKNYIKGEYLNKRIKKLRRFDSPGAQSYMIRRDSLDSLYHKIKDNVDIPADLLLDKEHDILQESLCTNKTIIGQMGIMMNSFFGNPNESKTHISNLYKSQTQAAEHLKRIHVNMDEFIEDVEDFDYHKEIGYIDNSSALGSIKGETIFWKKIIFKK